MQNFKKKARYDKEINLREKCRKIEEHNKKGRTRDLYKEIQDITGSYTARCGVMNLSSGKTATEEREVKIRWQYNNTQKSSTGEILKSLI